MIASRRLGRARHEFRFGTRELLIIGVGFCLVTGLVFAGGVLVGREMTRAKSTARVEVVPESRDADGPRAEGPVKTAATRAEERVTFYRTLTAPTSDLPQVGKPTIEERLIPKEDPAPSAPAAPAAQTAPVDPAPEPPRAAPERRASKTPEQVAGPRAVRAARAQSAPSARPTPAQVAGPGPGGDGDAWTVQVSAYRSRALAEELRSRLAARGFDAHVFPSITEDGRPRYRVRVGAYASRNDAERVASELRTERGLNPLVTSARVR